MNVADLDRSRRFYTEVLGFKVSDTYPGTMMPGGMVFLRSNGDHHCLALVGGAPATDAKARTLHHLAFELATLDEVFRARDHLKAQRLSRSSTRVAVAPAARSRSSSSIRTATIFELYWGVDQIGSDDRARPAEEWRQTMTLEDAVRIAPPGPGHDPARFRAQETRG